MPKIKYTLRYKANPEASERFEKSKNELTMTELRTDFPFTEEIRKEYETDIRDMERTLEDTLPGDYTRNKDVNSLSFYNSLKKNVGEEVLKSEEFLHGFKVLAHVVILKIMFCAFYQLEIFPGFIQKKKKNTKGNLRSTFITGALAHLIKYKAQLYDNLEEAGNEDERTSTQYGEEYSDDFAIISELIDKTVKNDDQMDAKPLFKDIVSDLESLFTIQGNPSSFPDGGHDGLRVLLFLVLQLVIVWKSSDLEKDLSALWRVYTKFLKNEKQETKIVPYEGPIFCHLAHHVLNLTVGFQNEESLQSWKEIQKCYPCNKQASNLVVENGKVDYRHVLSISSTMVLMWMVLDFRMDEYFKKAERKMNKSELPVNVREQYVHVVELGKIEKFIYPIETKRQGFISKMKSVPIFMYGFMLIRGAANTQYRPDLSSVDITKKETNDEEQSTGLVRFPDSTPILDGINIRLGVLEHWMAKNCPEDERHMIQALVESMHEARSGAPNTVTPGFAGLPPPKTLTTLSRDDSDNIGRAGLLEPDSSDEEENEYDSEDDAKPAANPNIKSSNNKTQPVNEMDPKKSTDISSTSLSAKRKGETLLLQNLKNPQPGMFLDPSDESDESSKKGDSPIIYDLEKDNDPKGKRSRANDSENK